MNLWVMIRQWLIETQITFTMGLTWKLSVEEREHIKILSHEGRGSVLNSDIHSKVC